MSMTQIEAYKARAEQMLAEGDASTAYDMASLGLHQVGMMRVLSGTQTVILDNIAAELRSLMQRAADAWANPASHADFAKESNDRT